MVKSLGDRSGKIQGLRKNVVARVKGIVKFSSLSLGATLAFPFMFFNGLTTVIGAGLILPIQIGYPIGILLSLTYFLVVSLRQIRRAHPLRRLFLVYLFAIGSTYTSFFSIYEQMTEGQLQYQSVEKTVNAHNQFINNIRISLNQNISQIEKEHPEIVEINSLEIELKELRDERANYEKGKQVDSAGERAESINDIKERLKSLRLAKNSPKYQIHYKIG